MRDSAPSKGQVTVAPRTSSVQGLPEAAIRKALRLDAIQHPTLIVPLALCISLLVYLVLYAPIFGGAAGAVVLLICAGAVTAGSFFWHYVVRYRREVERRLQDAVLLEDVAQREREQVELRGKRETLQDGFLSVDSIDGLKAVDALAREYEQLLPVLERRDETDPLSLAYVGSLAEQTYRQGLDALADALELARAVHSSNEERLQSEIAKLEREIDSLGEDETETTRIRMAQETIASHRERLDMIELQRLRRDKLLHQSHRCESSLAQARLELVALKADSSEMGVSALTETLQSTIRQAKEVQEELKALGF